MGAEGVEQRHGEENEEEEEEEGYAEEFEGAEDEDLREHRTLLQQPWQQPPRGGGLAGAPNSMFRGPRPLFRGGFGGGQPLLGDPRPPHGDQSFHRDEDVENFEEFNEGGEEEEEMEEELEYDGQFMFYYLLFVS